MDTPTQMKVTLADGTELTGEVVTDKAGGKVVSVPFGSAFLNAQSETADVTFEDLPPPDAPPLGDAPEPDAETETPAKRSRAK